MIKILITASTFTGSVELVYGEYGIGAEAFPPLLVVDFSGAQLDDKQKHFISRTAPVRYGSMKYEEQEYTWLEQWGKAALALTFTTMDVELEFERDFWIPFDNKQNRVRAEPLWDKHSKANHALIVAGMRKYLRYLQRVGYRGKMLPDKFIKDRHWQTDWDNLKQ